MVITVDVSRHATRGGDPFQPVSPTESDFPFSFSRISRNSRVFVRRLINSPRSEKEEEKETHVHAESTMVRGKNLANGNRESRAQ